MIQLGNRRYEGLLGPEALDISTEANYKEHELIGSKPMTQRVGDKLVTLSLTLRLHSLFCVVEDEVDELEKSRAIGYILGLYSAAGRYYGDFLIKTIVQRIEALNSDGSIMLASVSIELAEYYYQDRAAAMRRAARQVAFAIESNAVALPEGTEPTPEATSAAGQLDVTPGTLDPTGLAAGLPVITPIQVAANMPGPASTLPAVGGTETRQTYTLSRVQQLSGTALRLGATVQSAVLNPAQRPYLLQSAARDAAELAAQHGALIAALTGTAGNQNAAASGLLYALSGAGVSGGIGALATQLQTQAGAGDLSGAVSTSGDLITERGRIRAAVQPFATSAAVGRSII